MELVLKLAGQIIQLFNEGVSVQAIAEILHTSIDVVKIALSLAGIL
ncbi:hypothetical protein SAMN05444487_1284 [Marininema mesophilum]|uniref:Uncharacterized protein n=1 Tax=Marininema mesophilum TaxID=1048340 RepID=A0A1H3CV69_9BACL|nr:hypothetical protein [Marininema mesophilum]SDX57798.1 hypothetical protein SAMN05444487_1284 [Marininema mesophilum]